MENESKVPVNQDTESKMRTAGPAPWAGFGSLRDEVERLFDAFEPRHWFDRRAFSAGPGRNEMILRPSIDLTESDGAYAVSVELPGLDAEAINVKTSHGVLTIHGEKSEEKEEKEADYHLSERRWGSFQRSIRLPDNIDEDRIEAQYSKGVLTISLPKSKASHEAEKTIPVNAA